jgi:surface antigen
MLNLVRPLACAVLGAFACSALADPPPWAPAKGWRKKHDVEYVGYSKREWRDDYGVTAGRCNTDDVLAAVGAVAGGVIGNRVAAPENRVVATVVGAVIGAVIGDQVGDRIDARDRACVGHSLELARTGQTVRWVNPDSGLSYSLTPRRDRDGRCREFDLQVSTQGKGRGARMVGCTDTAGGWSLSGQRALRAGA